MSNLAIKNLMRRKRVVRRLKVVLRIENQDYRDQVQQEGLEHQARKMGSRT